MVERRTSCWADLPFEIVDLVMEKLPGFDIWKMGLVCKEWRAARTKFSGSSVLQIQTQDRMTAFCAALPSLSAVTIRNYAANLSLQPLSANSALRCAKLYNQMPGGQKYDMNRPEREAAIPRLDLSCLPDDLQSLAVSDFHFDKSRFDHVSLFQLTSLVLHLRPSSVSGIWSLLQMLPLLKELTLKEANTGRFISVDNNASNAFRFASLTSLELHRVNLTDLGDGPSKFIVNNLRELKLLSVVIDGVWFQLIANSLAFLTKLAICKCGRARSSNGELPNFTPSSTIRRLLLIWRPHYIGMAGPALQSLSYGAPSKWAPRNEYIPMDWHKVSLLGGLTQLAISDYNHANQHIVCLQQTGLVEVVLIRCRKLYPWLFVPGAFSRLKSLHVEDDCSCLHEPDGTVLERRTDGLQQGVGLPSLIDVVLDYPKLVQISGLSRDCSLVSHTAEGSEQWKQYLPRAGDWRATRCLHFQTIWKRKDSNLLDKT